MKICYKFRILNKTLARKFRYTKKLDFCGKSLSFPHIACHKMGLSHTIFPENTLVDHFRIALQQLGSHLLMGTSVL